MDNTQDGELTINPPPPPGLDFILCFVFLPANLFCTGCFVATSSQPIAVVGISAVGVPHAAVGLMHTALPNRSSSPPFCAVVPPNPTNIGAGLVVSTPLYNPGENLRATRLCRV